jgi:hypothetical protein
VTFVGCNLYVSESLIKNNTCGDDGINGTQMVHGRFQVESRSIHFRSLPRLQETSVKPMKSEQEDLAKCFMEH